MADSANAVAQILTIIFTYSSSSLSRWDDDVRRRPRTDGDTRRKIRREIFSFPKRKARTFSHPPLAGCEIYVGKPR